MKNMNLLLLGLCKCLLWDDEEVAFDVYKVLSGVDSLGGCFVAETDV